MKEIDLSKYEGKFSRDSSLLINILKDANLTADNVLFDDIDKEGHFQCKHNAKITKKRERKWWIYIFLF